MTSPRPTATAALTAALTLALGSGCAAPTLDAGSRSAATTATARPATTSPAAGSPSAASPSAVSPSAVAPTSASPAGTVIATADTGDFGTILVGAQGRTLYLSDRDTSTSSTCYDACAAGWPPVTTTGPPVAAQGVDDGLIGTTDRNDGLTQILYNGHPLYYFAGDAAQGDTNGAEAADFDTTWHVVNDQGSGVPS